MAETRLRLSRRQWRLLLADLAERGRGDRESGVFLLARANNGRGRVVDWVAFDDLDPHCLTGAISLRGSAFNRLWEICRERGLRVIADVHTHPSAGVAQSEIDASNPMVAQVGHIALIVPHFAQRGCRPEDVGFHVYLGDKRWARHLGPAARQRLRVGWSWPWS